AAAAAPLAEETGRSENCDRDRTSTTDRGTRPPRTTATPKEEPGDRERDHARRASRRSRALELAARASEHLLCGVPIIERASRRLRILALASVVVDLRAGVRIRTQIACVADTIAVRVRLIRISDRDAVVTP